MDKFLNRSAPNSVMRSLMVFTAFTSWLVTRSSDFLCIWRKRGAIDRRSCSV